MKTLKPTLIVLTLALAAMTLVADSGRTEERSTARRIRTGKQNFSVSGSYTGLLSGDIIVSGRPIFVPESALLYDVEDGVMEAGSVVASSSVSISGTIQNGDMIAGIIIIARDEGSDYSNTTMPNMIAPAGRPQ